MQYNKGGYRSIDEYITMYPENVQTILEELRATIKAAAPDAVEQIKYQMPTFVLKGNLVYFAVWKKHIGFYPASGRVPEVFRQELAGYKGTSGSIHFPIDKPLPLELIRDIVEFRVTEDLQHAEAESLKRKK